MLSLNFTLEEATFSETAIRKGIANAPNTIEFMNMRAAAVGMEQVRSYLLNKPITISSWYRNKAVNKLVGGASTSAHQSGWAVDFTCPKFGNPKYICNMLLTSDIKWDQLIFEGTWVHISFGPKMRGDVLTAVFSKGKKTTYLKGIV